MTRKRVYIAYTGGTIGMRSRDDGYAPEPGYFAELLATMPELRSPAIPEYTIHEYDPLLDSSNMRPQDWLELARDIASHYLDYDGFVVIHGTDTMAYTASALPFLFEGLRKPVVITGSQIPMCEVRNDARENLITSMLVAADYAIPEVVLCFGTKLLRGCRSVKVSAHGLDAFDSPNFPPLGRAGVDIGVSWDLVRPPEDAPFRLVESAGLPVVGALRLFPGISAELVRNVLQPPLRGLILEAYGVGNAPSRDVDLIAAISEATSRGVVIVDCTQCLHGSVDLNDYATGSALKRAGVVSGFDMTTEAALTKLFHLLACGNGQREVEAAMQRDMRGEVTLR